MRALLNRKNASKRAFTLIELIIVIAILGILIAVLVPVMTGFIGDARQNTADANARTVYSVAQAKAVFNTSVPESATPTSGTYTAGAGSNDFIQEIADELGDLASGEAEFEVTVVDGVVTKATFKASSTASEEGEYPKDAPAAPSPTT